MPLSTEPATFANRKTKRAATCYKKQAEPVKNPNEQQPVIKTGEPVIKTKKQQPVKKHSL